MHTDIITYGSVAFGAVYLLGRALVNFFEKEEKYDFYLPHDAVKRAKLSIEGSCKRRWPIKGGDTVICVFFPKKVLTGKVRESDGSYPLYFDNYGFYGCGTERDSTTIPTRMVIYEEDRLFHSDDVLGALDFIISEAKRCDWENKHKGRY